MIRSMETPTLTNVRLAAKAIGVPWPWLKAEAAAGRVPHLRAGRTVLFNVAAVRDALARRAAEPPAIADGRLAHVA